MQRRFMAIALAIVLAMGATTALAAKKMSKAAMAAESQKEISEQYNDAVTSMTDHKWAAAIQDLTLVIDNQAVTKEMKTDALVNRANCLANQKKEDMAIADFEKAMDLNPNREDIYYGKARAEGKIGKHEEAVADYTKAISLGKANDLLAGYYKNRGISYLAMEKRDLAKADFAKAKELNPKIKIPGSGKNL